MRKEAEKESHQDGQPQERWSAEEVLPFAVNVADYFQNEKKELVAYLMFNIAEHYASRGDNEEALGYYNKALAIHRKVLGSSHSCTANTHHHLAAAYQALGQLTNATEHYTRALAIKKKTLEKNHPSIVDACHSLAVVLEAQGNMEKAQHYYDTAKTICERIFGKEGGEESP